MIERELWPDLGEPDSWPKTNNKKLLGKIWSDILSELKLVTPKLKNESSGLQADLVDVELTKKTPN